MQEQLIQVTPEKLQNHFVQETNGWVKMSDKDYFALNCLSSHGLMDCLKSYNHYLSAKENQKDSKAMSFGRLAHLMALQFEYFQKNVVVAPELDRRTKAGKADYDAFLNSLNSDSIVCDPDDFKKLMCMRKKLDEVNQSPILKRYFDDIQLIEHAAIKVFAHDESLGDILLKGKPDAIGTDFILDYKTTQDAWIWGFERSAKNYRYDLQLRVYQKLDELITGELSEMVILAQESESPYEFQFYTIDNSHNQQTDMLITTALQKYVSGVLQTQPGYPREVMPLNLIRGY